MSDDTFNEMSDEIQKLREEIKRLRRAVLMSLEPTIQEAYELLSDHREAHGPASVREADLHSNDPELVQAQQWRERRDEFLDDTGESESVIDAIDAALSPEANRPEGQS